MVLSTTPSAHNSNPFTVREADTLPGWLLWKDSYSYSTFAVSLFADDATPLLGAEAWTMLPGEADFPPEPLPEPTDLQEEISTVNYQLSTNKVFRDGRILIERDKDIYTLLGEKLE